MNFFAIYFSRLNLRRVWVLYLCLFLVHVRTFKFSTTFSFLRSVSIFGRLNLFQLLSSNSKTFFCNSCWWSSLECCFRLTVFLCYWGAKHHSRSTGQVGRILRPEFDLSSYPRVHRTLEWILHGPPALVGVQDAGMGLFHIRQSRIWQSFS